MASSSLPSFGSSAFFDSMQGTSLSTSPSSELIGSSPPKKTGFINLCKDSVSERKKERSGSRSPHEQTEITKELSRKLSDPPDRRDSDGKRRPSRSKSPKAVKDKAQKTSEAFVKIYDNPDQKEASEYSIYPQRRSSGTKGNRSLTPLNFQELKENQNDLLENPQNFSETKRPSKRKTSVEFLGSPRGIHFASNPLRSKSSSHIEIPKPESKDLTTFANSEDGVNKGDLDFLIRPSKEEMTIEEKQFLSLPIKANKELESTLLQGVEKNEYSSVICTQQQLLKVYKKIIGTQKEILLPQIKKYSIFSEIEDVGTFSSEMVIKLQNELLEKSTIRQRLLDLSDCLVKLALQRKCKTPFMQFLYETLQDLISICTPLKDGFIFDRINKIEEFCGYISKINNQEPLPRTSKKSKFPKEKLIPIFSFLTKEMLEFLGACSNRQAKCDEYMDFFLNPLFQKVVDSIHKLKNLWSEPATQNGFFKSIDAISIKDMVAYYCRDGVALPIAIFIGKEKLVFPNTSNMEKVFNETSLSDEDFELQHFVFFFKQLYKAFGYEIKPLIIESQVKELLKKEESDQSKFTPETRACIRLMKMGCVEVWNKAHHYFNWRLGELMRKPSTASKVSKSNPLQLKEKNIKLRFHIDQKQPPNSFVQQHKIFEIHYVPYQFKVVEIPTTLKVFVPVPNSQNEMWNFELRSDSIKLNNACKEAKIIDDIIRDIKYYFVYFKNDEDVENRISEADKNHNEGKLKAISADLERKKINQEEADRLSNSFVNEIRIGHSFAE